MIFSRLLGAARNAEVRLSIIALTVLGTAAPVHAAPIAQVDEVVMAGPTYQNDIWTLIVSGPINATVAYTTTLADISGANIGNTADHWAFAINNDPTMGGFLTALVLSGPIGLPHSRIIRLTANVPGVSFLSAVSVYEASQTNTVEDAPLFVDVSTIVKASTPSIPLPVTLPLLLSALGGMRLVGWRRKSKRTSANHPPEPDSANRTYDLQKPLRCLGPECGSFGFGFRTGLDC